MATRDSVESRHQQKTENRYDQDDKRQVREIIKSRIEHRKPVLRDHKTKHLIDQPEPEERNPYLREDALQNVAMNVVSEFVGEDGLDFVVGVVIEKRVGENDAAGRTKAGKGGVRLL